MYAKEGVVNVGTGAGLAAVSFFCLLYAVIVRWLAIVLFF